MIEIIGGVSVEWVESPIYNYVDRLWIHHVRIDGIAYVIITPNGELGEDEILWCLLLEESDAD